MKPSCPRCEWAYGLLNTAGADHANKREDRDEQLYRQFCDSTSTISSAMAQCRENMMLPVFWKWSIAFTMERT